MRPAARQRTHSQPSRTFAALAVRFHRVPLVELLGLTSRQNGVLERVRRGADAVRTKAPAAKTRAAATSSRLSCFGVRLIKRTLPWSSFLTAATASEAADSRDREDSATENGPSLTRARSDLMSKLASLHLGLPVELYSARNCPRHRVAHPSLKTITDDCSPVCPRSSVICSTRRLAPAWGHEAPPPESAHALIGQPSDRFLTRCPIALRS